MKFIKFIIYVYTGTSEEYETPGLTGQLRLICHSVQRRRRGKISNSQNAVYIFCLATQKQEDTEGDLTNRLALIIPVCHT